MGAANRRAVIYVRTTRENVDEQTSILENYAKEKGLDVVKTFKDFMDPGVRNDSRTYLKNCLDECATNDIGCIVMMSTASMGHDPADVFRLLHKLLERNLGIFIHDRELYIGEENYIRNITTDDLEAKDKQANQKYVKNASKKGRKVGYRKPKDDMAKQYSKVIKKLSDGTPIRDIAKVCEVSPSTVQRVKKMFFPKS